MKVNPYKYGKDGQRTNTPVLQLDLNDVNSGKKSPVFMDEKDPLKLEIQTDYGNKGNKETKDLELSDGNSTTLLTYNIFSKQAAFILKLDLTVAYEYIIYGTLDLNSPEYVFKLVIRENSMDIEKIWNVQSKLADWSVQIFIPNKEMILPTSERTLFLVIKRYEGT